MIKIVLAGNEPYKKYVETAKMYAETVGYETIIFDLGGLDFGIPFEGRVKDEANAKIPCKPHIIEKALDHIEDNDFIVWLDSDAIIYERIDEIQDDWGYDIGVTVRKPKSSSHQLPINAGVVFVRKNANSLKFLKFWKELSDQGVSDQPPLNQLANVTPANIGNVVIRDNVRIKAFPCEIYNNFYFSKKTQPSAKIKHYKSKIRNLFPFDGNTIEKVSEDIKKKRADKVKQIGNSFKKRKLRINKERKERLPKIQKERLPKIQKERLPKTRKERLPDIPEEKKVISINYNEKVSLLNEIMKNILTKND